MCWKYILIIIISKFNDYWLKLMVCGEMWDFFCIWLDKKRMNCLSNRKCFWTRIFELFSRIYIYEIISNQKYANILIKQKIIINIFFWKIHTKCNPYNHTEILWIITYYVQWPFRNLNRPENSTNLWKRIPRIRLYDVQKSYFSERFT